MRNYALTAAMLAAAVSLGACHKTGSNANNDVAKPGDSAPVNTVQDAAAGPVGMASAAMPKNAQEFVTAAAMGDMYEVEAGKIAQQRGQSAAIKDFGAKMVTAHTETTKKLKAALASTHPDIVPPAQLDDRRQGMIDELRGAKDADFDGRYIAQQIDAHKEALILMKGYAKDGDLGALKSFASETDKDIRSHLHMAQDLNESVQTASK